MNILNFFGITLFIIFVYFSLRNRAVSAYRMEIINKIHTLNAIEIQKDIYIPNWRRSAFKEVSYNEMVLQFWKPLSSFYEGYDFNIK